MHIFAILRSTLFVVLFAMFITEISASIRIRRVADNANSISNKKIASLKSRAIAMNPGLCTKISRYHPHHPQCNEYCLKLDHWMGMCRHNSCHCYSI